MSDTDLKNIDVQNTAVEITPPAPQPSANTTKPLSNDLLILQMFDCVQHIFAGRPLDIKAVIELVGLAIQMAQNAQINHTFLSGGEKKSLVMHFIHYALDHLTIIDDDTKNYLENIFIPTLLSDLIDSLCNLQIQTLSLAVAKCGLCGKKDQQPKHVFPKDVKKKLRIRVIH